jgi:CubicO group peptidase (beta-lactamase class C family)
MTTISTCSAVTLAGALFLAVPPADAQAPLVERIAAYLSDAAARGDLHGSILVANKAGVLYEQSSGLANIQWDVANTADTKFRIGSMTKPFTAVLVMQQLEKGTLTLDDTISDHLSYYRQDTGSRVTIGQLLNHRSGIPNLTPDFSDEHERDSYSVRRFIELFCSGDLESAPGEKYSYSNAGYDILGAILEKVTGQSYGDVLKANIFDVVGMTDSVYSDDFRVLKQAAYGYRRIKEAPGQYLDAALLDPSVALAAAGIRSTVGDLYKWDRALYTETLLSDESKTLMYGSPPAQGSSYSHGWIQYRVAVPGEERSIAVTMHQGSINGFSGAIYRNRDTRDLVVILNNVSTNGSEWKIGEELMRMLSSSTR